MTEPTLINLVLLPVGLGLLGFVEPCSIGSTLVFIKYLEGKDSRTRLSQVVLFAITRAIFIGLLGVLAVVLGSVFFVVQKAAWVLLGALFVVVGLLFVVGKASLLMTTIGPSLGGLVGARGSIGARNREEKSLRTRKLGKVCRRASRVKTKNPCRRLLPRQGCGK